MDIVRRGRGGEAEQGDALWVKCLRCGELLYRRELEKRLKVCPKCGYHFRLSAQERIALLADEGSFREFDAHLRSDDPLCFQGGEVPYATRLAQVQADTGLADAAVCGEASLGGIAVVLGVLDFFFLGASMGAVVGEKVTRAIERAREGGRPLIVVSASGGARMHEGAISLMQMAKAAAALARLAQSRLPFISVLTDPTTGGVTASFASLGDVILAEPGALIGFAGPRVIEQVTRQKLPPGFQTAEFALEHGMIDMVVPRGELRDTIVRLLRLYRSQRNF